MLPSPKASSVNCCFPVFISMFLNDKYLLLYFTLSILDVVYWLALMVDEDLDLLHHHPMPVSCPMHLPMELAYSS